MDREISVLECFDLNRIATVFDWKMTDSLKKKNGAHCAKKEQIRSSHDTSKRN